MGGRVGGKGVLLSRARFDREARTETAHICRSVGAGAGGVLRVGLRTMAPWHRAAGPAHGQEKVQEIAFDTCRGIKYI